MSTQTQQANRILPKRLLSSSYDLISRLAYLFIKLKISPNAISLTALVAGMGAGLLFFLEKPLSAGLVIILCGIFDIIDGKVAASTKRTSLFGAIFDSTLDRYSEFFIYICLAAYFRNHWALWVAILAFLGSAMVSYTRARAEGLGIECKIGIMQRAERLVFLCLGSIIGSLARIFDPVMIAVLAVIALISNFTAFQRAFYVKKIEKQGKLRKED